MRLGVAEARHASRDAVGLLGTQSYPIRRPDGRRSRRILAAMPARHDPETHVRVAFFQDGRLTSLPSRTGYRLAALAVLAERFVPARRYTEPEVNGLLADDALDPATLRRLLVDHGLVRRAGGEYWREA
jgi:hypothetical protein